MSKFREAWILQFCRGLDRRAKASSKRLFAAMRKNVTKGSSGPFAEQASSDGSWPKAFFPTERVSGFDQLLAPEAVRQNVIIVITETNPSKSIWSPFHALRDCPRIAMSLPGRNV